MRLQQFTVISLRVTETRTFWKQLHAHEICSLENVLKFLCRVTRMNDSGTAERQNGRKTEYRMTDAATCSLENVLNLLCRVTQMNDRTAGRKDSRTTGSAVTFNELRPLPYQALPRAWSWNETTQAWLQNGIISHKFLHIHCSML